MHIVKIIYPWGNFYEVEEPKVLPFLMHASGSERFIADFAWGIVVVQATGALSPLDCRTRVAKLVAEP